MPIGKEIAKWTGQITSVKVLPFENPYQSAKYELTILGEYKGEKLNGHGMGTSYWEYDPEGTVTLSYYVVLTSPGDDVNEPPIYVEWRGAGVPIDVQTVKIRASVLFMTRSEKFNSWNKKILVFEGKSGSSEGGGIEGTLYEWD